MRTFFHVSVHTPGCPSLTSLSNSIFIARYDPSNLFLICVLAGILPNIQSESLEPQLMTYQLIACQDEFPSTFCPLQSEEKKNVEGNLQEQELCKVSHANFLLDCSLCS